MDIKPDYRMLDSLAGKAKDYVKFETRKPITWCGGCGNYAIQNALKRALTMEGIRQNEVVICFDIGCNGNGSDKIEAFTIHGLHGRVISLAAGASISNKNMKVIAHGGDGGTFSEGIGHLVHAVRNNYPFLFIHHNNENYGLTVGQASALTRKGVKMNGTPDGVILDPINSLDFVLTLDPSFVARGYSGEVDHLTELFRVALRHDGFAFVEVLQACPTYNKETPDHWYNERVKDISALKDYDRSDIWQARKLVQDIEKDIYIGLLYENKERKSYMEMQPWREGVDSALVDEVKGFGDVEELMG